MSALPTEPSVDEVDVVIIGGGPAGLSAALNLGRAGMRVVVVDAGRPRNAATLRSHGFLTRDGVTPIELRKLAQEELAAYPHVDIRNRVSVRALRAGEDGGFRIELPAKAGETETLLAPSVLLATGLSETLPDLGNLRSYYGMSVFSCVICDSWELRDRPLAFIGETPDLVTRALLISRWSDRLTVFTNASTAVTDEEEHMLLGRGIAVERRPVAELEGERGAISAVRLEGGGSIPAEGGFVRPLWRPAVDFLDGIDLERDGEGYLVTDLRGRTQIPGLYAAGDLVAPGPQQLIVAAGSGARVAATILDDTALA